MPHHYNRSVAAQIPGRAGVIPEQAEARRSRQDDEDLTRLAYLLHGPYEGEVAAGVAPIPGLGALGAAGQAARPAAANAPRALQGLPPIRQELAQVSRGGPAAREITRAYRESLPHAIPRAYRELPRAVQQSPAAQATQEAVRGGAAQAGRGLSRKARVGLGASGLLTTGTVAGGISNMASDREGTEVHPALIEQFGTEEARQQLHDGAAQQAVEAQMGTEMGMAGSGQAAAAMSPQAGSPQDRFSQLVLEAESQRAARPNVEADARFRAALGETWDDEADAIPAEVLDLLRDPQFLHSNEHGLGARSMEEALGMLLGGAQMDSRFDQGFGALLDAHRDSLQMQRDMLRAQNQQQLNGGVQ